MGREMGQTWRRCTHPLLKIALSLGFLLCVYNALFLANRCLIALLPIAKVKQRAHHVQVQLIATTGAYWAYFGHIHLYAYPCP